MAASATTSTPAHLRKRVDELKRQIKSLKPAAEHPRYEFKRGPWARFTKGMDKQERAWLLDGISNGFDIQVDDTIGRRVVKQNLPMSQLELISAAEWVLKNIKKRAVWGPFKGDGSDLPSWLKDELVESPIGTVKKGMHFNTPDELKKWRVIHHLSYPRSGPSINTEVHDEWATVQYVQFREVVQMVASLGPAALLWTVDAKDAYLRVPIKRRCLKFMGFRLFNRLFVFTSLSFGLSSAPKIYTKFADAILEIAISRHDHPGWWHDGDQPRAYHYIDDFFGGAPAATAHIARKQFMAIIDTFQLLSVPTTGEKCTGPATRIKILGFIYDTVKQMVFIPELKKQAMLSEINAILARKQVTKQQVLSLVGKLRWASVCIFAGPAFVRRMEFQANKAAQLSHRVAVRPMADDLRWWAEQIQKGADGVRFDDILRHRANGDVNVYTDASTGDGMGGWNRDGQWFQYRWADHPAQHLFPHPQQPDIYWKEMCAVATAAIIWGDQWQSKAITFWIDNEACVWSLAKRRCDFAREDVMELIRVIASCANKWSFQPYFIHIAGKDNMTADALSRFDVQQFQSDTAGIQMNAAETPCSWALDFLVSRSLNDAAPPQ